MSRPSRARALPPGTRGLLIDIDGTLLDADRPIPGAAAALARLRAAGLSVRFLTNTSRRGCAVIGAVLRAAGYDAADGEVLTPALLARRLILDAGAGRAALFVTPEARRDFDGIVDSREAPGWVVLGDLGEGFTHATLNEALGYLLAGARLVALHRHTWWTPPGGRPALDVGAYVAALEEASGRPALLVGKPSPAFFALALEEIGLPPAEVVVVGDDAGADAAGAVAAGCHPLLVETGRHRPGEPVPEGVPVIASFADLG